MLKNESTKILIVDDVTENIKVLIELLKNDYTTFFAKNGKTALELVKTKKPDLILLDIIMPEMDGYEVCAKLKEQASTKEIPVIFVSSMNETGDETKGFELGAVDYIIKPISPPILQARVKTHLKLRYTMQELKRLCSMALDANPLTELPGNNSIKEVIEEVICEKKRVGVIYTDLDNFKAFNDKYGFAMGDKVIKFTADVIKDSLSSLEISDSDSFIGHIGGDDFVVISPSDKIYDLCKEIIKKFDQGIIKFYNPEDAAAKCICSINRRFEQENFPIMSISMAGIDLANDFYKEYLELNDVLAGLKKSAKAVEGSIFLIDRRVKIERS